MFTARVRGRLNSNFQLMLTVGILMAFTVNYFSHTFRTGWRTSLGVSAAFSAVLSIGMVLFSESPRWLLKQGRKYEAERTLNRVYPGSPAVVSREMLALTVRSERGFVFPAAAAVCCRCCCCCLLSVLLWALHVPLRHVRLQNCATPTLYFPLFCL